MTILECISVCMHLALGHALACRSGIPILFNECQSNMGCISSLLAPAPTKPMRSLSVDQSAQLIRSGGCNVLATLSETHQRVACVVSSLAL